MGYLEENDFSKVPIIPQFYKGKTIFITGGSGFMGKVLIEKLLYSCPDLERIYLLLRTKKGTKAEDRLTDLYSSICFDRLRKEKPGHFESKVFVVGGDMMEIGLGLSQEDRMLLVKRVNIVFNVAASVRFDDSLTYAAKLNIRGTRELIEIARDMKDIYAFVHISTAYSNTNQKVIDEIMYPPHSNWREVINIVETLDENTLKVFTPKYMGIIPNTYAFTKQLAESAVYEQRGVLPLVMVRPSIVVSSIEEPTPGWVENFNGPVGLLVASAKGIMRSVYSDPDLIADYIPVDSAIRNIIAAGWVRGVKKLKPTDDMPIFNCCAGTLNNMTMNELVETGKQITNDTPVQGMVWNVGGSITNYRNYHILRVFLFHLLPALFLDSILYIIGKKTMIVKIQRKIYTANMALSYYITNQWTFINTNFMKLREIIKGSGVENFNYYIEDVDKYEYFKKACDGGRWYLLKEKDEDLPKARAHFKRMFYLEKIVQIIALSCVAWCLSYSKTFMGYFNSFFSF